MKDFTALEQNIEIIFKDKSILDHAFVHRSYLNENDDKKSNERLEFLGDAVLELVVTDYLFSTFPTLDEGVLTSYRSAVVRGSNLALIAQNLELGQYLYLSRGEEGSGGREKHYILANTVEALVGAIYLDQGWDVSTKFIHKWIITTLDNIISEGLYLDAKTYFQEKAQEILSITPHYKVLKEEGPDHDKSFTVGAYLGDRKSGEGEGTNKQEAEQSAAMAAIKARGWIG
ncbi:MAG: ribonuclease III [Candidatus Peregrinibacteria bacterium]|nr:ribonuclease III [Candidatus Peregrinibacteria bacterium]MDZ4244827.1 ribonuclease III [Candidatus Gracilibacteria bacterium]